MLKLARKLVNQPGLRQGSLSKAARGYHLGRRECPRVLRETPILRVVPKASVEQGMEAALELALSQWQYHEELWARNVKNAKKTGAGRYGAGTSYPDALWRNCTA